MLECMFSVIPGEDKSDETDDKNDHASLYAPSISGSKRTTQSLLTVEEDEIFNETFSTLIRSSKPIITKDVVKMIKKEPKLCELPSRLTNRQMADTVRTRRKALLRTNEMKEKLKGKAKRK